MISFGARGVIGMEATLYGLARALHDGHYGNWVPNGGEGGELIASMRARRTHPHPRLSRRRASAHAAESIAVASLPPVEDQLRREFGIARGRAATG
jgi:hypothetical protein